MKTVVKRNFVNEVKEEERNVSLASAKLRLKS